MVLQPLRLGAADRGFTLIELMIVVAVLGILTVIAYPSYVEHINTGRRTDAQRVLLEQVNTLERAYSRQGQYPENLTVPSNPHYLISYSRPDTAAFVLKASPNHTDTRCGVLSINQLGVRSAASGDPRCWREH